MPSFISTLGVLGTFGGITLGLMNFNTGDLNASIPLLLEGLKTAFYTSLAGMIGSLILSRYINSLFDKEEGGVSDINQAASEIVKAVREMSAANKNTLHELKQQTIIQSGAQAAFFQSAQNHLVKMDDTISQLKTGMDGMTARTDVQNNLLDRINNESMSHSTALRSIDNLITETNNRIGVTTSNLASIEKKIVDESKNLMNVLHSEVLEIEGKMDDTNNKLGTLATMDRNLSEMLDVTSNLVSIEQESVDESKKLKDILHAEVIEIEGKMDDTNRLLTQKFDEFTELLKKSNTEALVEVMKKVTEEFQKQMSELINKLVQENFDQLNKSVERLNTWQQENKEMISSLTRQYKQMADNFESTSTTLTKVGDDTKLLVSDGGKLEQIVDSLSQIMIEDERFVQITTKLADTVDMTQNNMKLFEESNKMLNDWVKKQRNFVEGVQALIQKLDELNALRNYNEQFWQSTKRSMEEGVGILSSGTQTLKNQLSNLDQRFYNRLAATLANLDKCIQTVIENYE
ncbi:MAG: hypothetical protein IKK07_05275 [Bacteroides sp.]|nr:hypothetical protein [Bacteroides sp.]